MMDHTSQRPFPLAAPRPYKAKPRRNAILLILGISILILLPSTQPLQAQDEEAKAADLIVQIDHVDASDFPKLRYYVTVKDAEGEPVVGLEQGNFAIIPEDTKEQGPPESAKPTTEVSDEETPQLFLALVVNNSQSLADIRKEFRKAVYGFTGASKARGFKIALLAFEGAADVYQSKIKTLTEFTSDKFAIDQGLTEMELYDNSIIYDTLYKAIRYARQEAGYRRAAVVLFTLSKDRKSIYTMEQCIEFAREEHVPIFPIGLEGRFLTAIFVNYNKKRLTKLADSTGGRFLPCKKVEYLAHVLKTVLDTTTGRYLENQYILVYEDQNLYSEKRERRYTIRVTRGAGEEKVEGASDCEIKLSKANLDNVLATYLAKAQKRGERYVKDKDFAKAVKLIEEIAARTTTEPEDVSFFSDAYLGYGDALSAEGKTDEAIAAYKKVGGDEAKKRISIAYAKKGDELLDGGNLTEAIDAYKESGEPQARSALRAAYVKHAKSLAQKVPPLLNEAIENLKSALEIDPHFTDAIYGLADASSQLVKDLVVQNRLDRAAAVLADASKAASSESADVKRNAAKRLASAYLELGRAAYGSCNLPIAVDSLGWVCENWKRYQGSGETILEGETVEGLQIEYARALIANLDFDDAIAVIKERITDDVNNEAYWAFFSLAVKAKYYHSVVKCIQIFADEEKDAQSVRSEISALPLGDEITYYGVVGKDGKSRFWRTRSAQLGAVRATPEVVKEAVKSGLTKETVLLSTVSPQGGEDMEAHFVLPIRSAGADTPVHSYFRLGISARSEKEDYVRKQLLKSLSADDLCARGERKTAVKVYEVCAKVLAELMGRQLSRLADIKYVARPYISHLTKGDRVKYIVVAGDDGQTTSIPKALERSILNDKKANEMRVLFKQSIKYEDSYITDVAAPVYSPAKQWKGVIRLGIVKARAL